ncbi:hypothetical protein [Acidisoma sp.]|uniref:hypothetical protein n=1 Tax=Acidisoma sp. TaxID=1872115 RepID=UPI003B0047B1
MRALELIRDELWGLFVDDGVFAGAIVVWLAVAWRVLPHLGLPDWMPALLLFAGLGAILVSGALRETRKRDG